MIDLEGARLRDASAFGVVLGSIAVALGGYAVYAAVGAATGLWPTGFLEAGFAALVGVVFAGVFYEDIQPYFDGNCDHCGERVVVNDGADRADRYTMIRATGAPKRVTVGPVSFAGGKQVRERYYCSTACADADGGPDVVDGHSERLLAGETYTDSKEVRHAD
jgi:hypothetical protein